MADDIDPEAQASIDVAKKEVMDMLEKWDERGLNEMAMNHTYLLNLMINAQMHFSCPSQFIGYMQTLTEQALDAGDEIRLRILAGETEGKSGRVH